jgi:hypothetical protein
VIMVNKITQMRGEKKGETYTFVDGILFACSSRSCFACLEKARDKNKFCVRVRDCDSMRFFDET